MESDAPHARAHSIGFWANLLGHHEDLKDYVLAIHDALSGIASQHRGYVVNFDICHDTHEDLKEQWKIENPSDPAPEDLSSISIEAQFIFISSNPQQVKKCTLDRVFKVFGTSISEEEKLGKVNPDKVPWTIYLECTEPVKAADLEFPADSD